MWTVYLLECVDGTLYCGITKDLDRRVKCHNDGQGARYTRSRLPVRVVASKAVTGHGEALRLEYAIKQLPRSKKVQTLQ